MCATFNGNPSTTIVSGYSPTNANSESDITTFNNVLFFLARHKNNIQIVSGDMNT